MYFCCLTFWLQSVVLCVCGGGGGKSWNTRDSFLVTWGLFQTLVTIFAFCVHSLCICLPLPLMGAWLRHGTQDVLSSSCWEVISEPCHEITSCYSVCPYGLTMLNKQTRFAYHFCCWMKYLHLFQNGSTIISNCHITTATLYHLVHSSWSKTCTYCTGYSCE